MRETSARHLYFHFDFTEETDSPTLSTLAQILVTSPHLALYIRRIVVNLNFLFDSSVSSVELDLSSLRSILLRAQRIERLTIWGYAQFEFESFSPEPKSPSFHLEDYDSVPVLPVMSVYNAVESLADDKSYHKQPTWKDVTIKSAHRRLVCLRQFLVPDQYDNAHGQGLFGLHSPIDFSHLRILELQPGSVLADELFTRVLDCTSPTLEVFYLPLGNFTHNREMPSLLRLPLPRLNTLHIGLPTLTSLRGGTEEKVQHAIEFATRVLDGLARPNHTPSLTSIMIRMRLSGPRSADIRTRQNFRGLDQVLTRIAEHGRLREIGIAFIDLSRSRATFSEPDFWKILMETDFQSISALKEVNLTLTTTY